MISHLIVSVVVTLLSFFLYGVYVESILDDKILSSDERAALNRVRVLGRLNPGIRFAMFTRIVWSISRWMRFFLAAYLISVCNLYISLALYIYLS